MGGIQAVVPSIDVWVSMSAELPRPEVVVDEARWKVIVATGAGATVAEVGDRLGLGEIGISKAVKEVVVFGLLHDQRCSREPDHGLGPRCRGRILENPVMEELRIEEPAPVFGEA